jgi:hypothetical protein
MLIYLYPFLLYARTLSGGTRTRPRSRHRRPWSVRLPRTNKGAEREGGFRVCSIYNCTHHLLSASVVCTLYNIPLCYFNIFYAAKRCKPDIDRSLLCSGLRRRPIKAQIGHETTCCLPTILARLRPFAHSESENKRSQAAKSRTTIVSRTSTMPTISVDKADLYRRLEKEYSTHNISPNSS